MDIPEFIQPSFFLNTGFVSFFPPIIKNGLSSILAHVHRRPNIYDSPNWLSPTCTPHAHNWLFAPGKVKWPPLLHIFIIGSWSILWGLGWVSTTPAMKEALMSKVLTFTRSSQRKHSEYRCGWVGCRQENWRWKIHHLSLLSSMTKRAVVSQNLSIDVTCDWVKGYVSCEAVASLITQQFIYPFPSSLTLLLRWIIPLLTC